MNKVNTTPDHLRLLSALLASPTADSLGLLHELEGEHDWLSGPLEELKNAGLAEWQAEHTRLFINGHPKTVCPPFESAFLRGGMFGVACDELTGFYQRAGLRAEDMPADYFGTQLECAAWLLEQQCDHSSALLQELWDRHLAIWAPRFAATLQAESRLMLYRQLGQQLEEAIQ